MRILKNICLVVAAIAAVSGLSTASAFAAAFLMTTDGVSSFNNSRATSLGHTVTTAASGTINSFSQAALSAYDVIWYNPGMSTGTYANLQAGVAPGGALQQYAFNGGTLVLNVAGNSGSFNNIAPGLDDYVNYAAGSATHEAETFADPSSPYLTGAFAGGTALSAADFNSWNSTDHGHLTNLFAGANVILSNTNGASLIEYAYGSGFVIVSTLTYGWGSGGARGAPLDNLINYAAQAEGIPAPAPGALALLGLGLLGIRATRRKRV